MTNDNIKVLLGAFVTLIVGLILITSVSTETLQRTEKDGGTATHTIVMNDTAIPDITTVYSVTDLGDTSVDCVITGVAIKNGTGTALTDTTHYVFDTATGKFTLTAAASDLFDRADNTTTTTYTYCPSGYINIGWGRTVVNMVPGFFGLALLGVSLWLFYTIGKNTGLIN